MHAIAQKFWRSWRAFPRRAVLLAALWVGLLHAPRQAGAEPVLRWRWSNPKPHGGNIVDLAYAPAQGLAVEVAELGQAYSSFDLSLWTPLDTGTTNDLRAVTFFGSRLLI